jgi:hypothetical protein
VPDPVHVEAAKALRRKHLCVAGSTTELGGQTLKIQTPARFRAQPGDRVWIQLGEEHQRWFDPQTALALGT